MPFKLKLKKTRQYNVASKSLFVISVELLDGGIADCTLSVDSTGQECLDNVCQRQAINQPEFFGLRYVNRNQQPRWVQLDRPLKLQLDKYASSHQLYLRVMYYVISGTSLITDEVTRYHYFLQLKNDLVEGRIICDCEQAVVLASYSRQAEYGNHDRERHTVEYLKNLLTFPKQMLDGGQVIDSSSLAETGRLEWLTAAVIQHHMSLNNMSQAQAEEGFITTCQQLRGYGQEMYAAKDKRDQTEVTIAISLTGIRVLTDTSDTPHFYRWMDITNVINHKRTFSVECQQRDSASFSLPSPEDGKYVWRMCVLQHTFYMKHQTALNAAVDEPRPKFQEHGLSESREELSPCGAPLAAAGRARSASCLELAETRALGSRALLPMYRPAPDYETAVQQKYGGGGGGVGVGGVGGGGGGILAGVGGRVGVVGAGSQPDVRRAHFPDVTRHTAPADDYAYGLKYVGNYPVQADRALHYVNVYKPPPPYPSNGLASNSTPDLAVAGQALGYRGGYVDPHVSGSSPDLVSTRTALSRQYLGYAGPHGVVDYGRTNVSPATHGTFNNLASVLEPNHIILDPHLVSEDIQKVYDERGNVMYSMPVRRISYQRHVVVPSIRRGETQEPIYENVPLPWQAERRTMRERAQSLTTTDELARLNERNGSHPIVDNYGNLKIDVPFVPKLDNDSHYMNAQIIKGVRELSVPRESSDRSAHDSKENVALNLDRISLKNDEKDYDETPYTSLSTHRVSNNNTISKSVDNVTSINISDVHDGNTSRSTDSALSSSILNSTYSTSIELEGSKPSAKEKKRRRWGMFMGRSKNVEVKSATLGRDRAKVGQTTNKHRWSTGLPKFQPLPPSITKETLCQLLERKMSDEQLSFSFSQIPKAREATSDHRTTVTTAHATTTLAADPATVTTSGPVITTASARADAQHGLPYDDNRVRLHPTPGNPHGYINASHITMTVGSSQRFYVLIQATASEQASLLWECVWQVGARVLALVDGDPPHYLPDDRRTATYGQFQVSCGDWSVASWGGSRRVTVRRMGGPGAAGASRALWHVRCTWPAEVSGFLDFISEINGLSQACEAEAAAERSLARNAPVAVCGRGAGVALTAHLLLHVLDTNQELDIPRTVSLLHQQRASLLQNVQQYRFLHLVLLHYLKRSRLI